jgi:hypothetical protein
MMAMLGSFGIFFSTVLKRTMLSVISTYGVALFIFVGTGILYFVVMSVVNEYLNSQPMGGANAGYHWIGHIIAWNPVAALYSILDPAISDEAFRAGQYNATSQPSAPMPLWLEFMIIYTVLSAAAIWMSIRRLRPRLNRRK